MKRFSVLIAAFLPVLIPGFGQSASSASGNGPFVVPTSAAYADLGKVAYIIHNDNPDQFKDREVIIYDPQTFGMLPMYPSAVDQLKDAMTRFCALKPPETFSAEALSDVLTGAGTALSGVAALIGAVTPTYAIQGQSFTIDNNALIAAFINEIRPENVLTAYPQPAAASSTPGCGNFLNDPSFSSLWTGAAAMAVSVRTLLAQPGTTDARKKEIQAALDYYQSMRDTYLAADKGPSLYSKLLAVETIWNAMTAQNGKPVTVIDMKLDSAGIDSTTRTWFGKKTTFSDNLLAHYFLFTVERVESQDKKTIGIKLHLAKADTVQVTNADRDLKSYAKELQDEAKKLNDEMKKKQSAQAPQNAGT